MTESPDLPIPAEAREAVAQALWHEVWSLDRPYSEASDAERHECEVSATAVLAAALPHLRSLQVENLAIGKGDPK